MSYDPGEYPRCEWCGKQVLPTEDHCESGSDHPARIAHVECCPTCNEEEE